MTEQITDTSPASKVRAPRLRRPPYPLSIVIWDDAFGTASEVTIEELSHRAWRVHTVGWVLRDDERGVSVAGEWLPDQGTWRGVTFVPRGMLVEVRKL